MSVTINQGKYWTKSQLRKDLGLSVGQLDFVLQKNGILGLKIGNTTIFNEDQYVEIARARTTIRKGQS